jgi:hypothetical protein
MPPIRSGVHRNNWDYVFDIPYFYSRPCLAHIPIKDKHDDETCGYTNTLSHVYDMKEGCITGFVIYTKCTQQTCFRSKANKPRIKFLSKFLKILSLGDVSSKFYWTG